MLIHEELALAKKLISDPACWTKGAYAKGADGKYTSPTGLLTHKYPNPPVCFCSVGAIAHVIGSHNITEHIRYLNMAVNGLVVTFNDQPATTHEDVMKAFSKAIELAKLYNV